MRLFEILLTGLAIILITFISSSHMCSLQSYIVEIPLFILTLSTSCIWTAKAKSAGQAWIRTFGAIAIVVFLHIAYQGWLHSDNFPKILLSTQALESLEKMKKMMDRSKK